MGLAPILGRSSCLPLQAAEVPRGEDILTLPKHGAASSPSSSVSGLNTATQATALLQVGVPKCALFLFQHPRKCQSAGI